MQYPFIHELTLDRTSNLPLFLQLSQTMAASIKSGRLKANFKLPSARNLAQQLNVNRHTVQRAYDELEAQSYVYILPKSGAYVCADLPLRRAQDWDQPHAQKTEPFDFYIPASIPKPLMSHLMMGFDDGAPDIRLAPLKELSRAFARQLKILSQGRKLYYTDAMGSDYLRNVLAESLNKTRGLHIGPQNIMITRGSQMAILLAAKSILKPGDMIAVAKINYVTSNYTFKNLGAQLYFLALDAEGVVPESLEQACQKNKIRAVYLTPHHHHPTTVTLSIERRRKILELAVRYNFAIIEDDYDYSFHYDQQPMYPMASADVDGRVLYCGSFTKAIAPAFRIGYLVGPAHLIQELPRIRRILDRQGDEVLESAIAELIENQTIDRFLKKANLIYKKRCDHFCDRLASDFSDVITFQKPKGGLAVWARFDAKISLPQLSAVMQHKNVFINDGTFYAQAGSSTSAIRMGFAGMEQSEMNFALEVLADAIESL